MIGTDIYWRMTSWGKIIIYDSRTIITADGIIQTFELTFFHNHKKQPPTTTNSSHQQPQITTTITNNHNQHNQNHNNQLKFPSLNLKIMCIKFKQVRQFKPSASSILVLIKIICGRKFRFFPRSQFLSLEENFSLIEYITRDFSNQNSCATNSCCLWWCHVRRYICSVGTFLINNLSVPTILSIYTGTIVHVDCVKPESRFSFFPISLLHAFVSWILLRTHKECCVWRKAKQLSREAREKHSSCFLTEILIFYCFVSAFFRQTSSMHWTARILLRTRSAVYTRQLVHL